MKKSKSISKRWVQKQSQWSKTDVCYGVVKPQSTKVNCKNTERWISMEGWEQNTVRTKGCNNQLERMTFQNCFTMKLLSSNYDSKVKEINPKTSESSAFLYHRFQQKEPLYRTLFKSRTTWMGFTHMKINKAHCHIQPNCIILGPTKLSNSTFIKI